jgi:hypothetical protein
MKTTKLGTRLQFNVIDMRGKSGFPDSPKGLVYEHVDKRIVRKPYTGVERQLNDTYFIRVDPHGRGWRIDQQDLGLYVAVHGPDRQEYWHTASDAAHALADTLGVPSASSRRTSAYAPSYVPPLAEGEVELAQDLYQRIKANTEDLYDGKISYATQGSRNEALWSEVQAAGASVKEAVLSLLRQNARRNPAGASSGSGALSKTELARIVGTGIQAVRTVEKRKESERSRLLAKAAARKRTGNLKHVYRQAKIPSGVKVAPGYVIMESVTPGKKPVYAVHRRGDDRTAGPFASQSLASAVKASWGFKKLQDTRLRVRGR